VNKKHNIWLALFLLLALPATHVFAATKKDAAQPGKTAPAKPVDLNNASQSELVAVPGIGTSTAKKIMAGRPYSSVDDLSKAGIPKTTLDKIRPNVTVSAVASKPSPTAKATPAVAPTPAAAAPTPAAAPPSAPAAKTTKTVAASAPQPAPPPGSGQVWVNLESKIYHKEGDRYYGKTKKGKYMSEADAIKAGYRAAKTT
jgi:hypothetical protein